MFAQPSLDGARGSEAPIPVLISCHNRPLYLWACLDSLYRNTRYPHRFTMLDMASEDPQVAEVIAGFKRRGMFSQVIRATRNQTEEFWKVVWSLVEDAGELFGYVEGDVIVEESEPCWLGRLVGLMEKHPRLAMVGSAIDNRDFVSWERARAVAPDLDEQELSGLIKLHSPERLQDLGGVDAGELARPHNPPGRLLVLRSAPLTQIGPGTDGQLDRKFREAGYDTGVAPGVRHRHLSLLNLYDYAEYDMARRDAFMKSVENAGGS